MADIEKVKKRIARQIASKKCGPNQTPQLKDGKSGLKPGDYACKKKDLVKAKKLAMAHKKSKRKAASIKQALKTRIKNKAVNAKVRAQMGA